MNKKEFQPDKLREQWDRFCETHDEDRWESISARIDEEAAHAAAQKQPHLRRPLMYSLSACVAAAAIILACLPFMGDWRDLAGANPDLSHNDSSTNTELFTDNTSTDHTTTTTTPIQSTTSTDDSTTDSTSTVTQPTTPAIRPSGSSGEGTGGSSTVEYYKADRMSCPQNDLFDWMLDQYGEDAIMEFYDWTKWKQNCLTDVYPDIYNAVRYFEIPREVFERKNQETYDLRSDPESVIYSEWCMYHECYTPEEIEDIYTLSRLEFNRKYAAEDAVVTAEGHIYSSTWFVTHPVSDWQELGFTVEEVWQSLVWAHHYADAPYTNSPSDYYFGRYMNRSSYSAQGFAVFEEKLIFFAAEKAGVTVPNSGDGRYNTYISHARWRGIGNAYSQYILQNHSQEAIDAFEAQLAAEQSDENYTFKGDAINRWVAHFEIPRAAFEQINDQQKTYYKDTYGEDSFEYWDNVYTDEEIDDIYTLSLAEFNMKYANPCTLVVGEELYPFGWFLENRISEWWEELEIREKYLEALLVEFKKVYPNETEDIANFKEKLEDYINNHGK